jgi:exodeoxyribonuclease V alpha subunit
MNQTDELIGSVERIVFHNQETGFAVFVLTQPNKKQTTISGTIPALQAGQEVHLTGSWIMHPKFGQQFQAATCSTALPSSINGLRKYLGSGMIKGIGKSYAEKLVNHFGTTILDIIDKHPERLHEVPGIGEKRAQQIAHAWQDQKEISTIMVFLQDKGVSASLAIKIYKRYGQQSLALVQENPYRLAEDIWGIGFKSADKIALALGFGIGSQARIKAGIMYAITECTQAGHLYAQLDELKKKTEELLELEPEMVPGIKTALHQLHDEQKIKLITYQEKHYITTSMVYYTEKGVSSKLQSLLKEPSLHSFDTQAIYTKLRTASGGIALNEDQQHGIMTALSNKVTIITGGPGTGKTTLIKQLLTVLEEQHVRYRLAAPTGRAAKRIIEGTGRHAVTMHRLLEFDPANGQFKHNEKNALALDFLIVDEASMIDIFLAHALLRALPLQAHLILIGDVDQLPSVGPGSVLSDSIASGKIPTIRLTTIFRQAQDSMIVMNAHKINRGEFPSSTPTETSKRDFIFISEQEPERVIEHLKTIFSSTLRKAHIAARNATVLVPMNRGAVGTIKLNHDLQQMLNGGDLPSLMHGGTVFKQGDRVMQIKNNYDKIVFNGDIGIIETIDTEEKQMSVIFDDKAILYELHECDELVLAYSISIHKSQGSEYDAVIVPLFMQHFMMLQRNLIYTALTRAKTLAIFIGQPKAFAMAIKNNKGSQRITFLQQFLTSDLAAR